MEGGGGGSERAGGAGRGREGRGQAGRALRGGVGTGPGASAGRGTGTLFGDSPQLWANVGEDLTVVGAGGGGRRRRGAGVSQAADRAAGLAERAGFRAAINEARRGRQGVLGFGPRCLPPPSKTFLSAELGAWACAAAAPCTHRSRRAAGLRAGEQRWGWGWGWGQRGAGIDALGGPPCPPAPFPRCSLHPHLPWRIGFALPV